MPGPPERVDLFLRRNAITRGFSLGLPRSFTVASDGSRVAFLRSSGPEDPVQSLWTMDVATGDERLVADPRELLGRPESDSGPQHEASAAERARRERVGEVAEGIVAYAGDGPLLRATFTAGGRLFLADLLKGTVRELAVPGAPDDPRLDPTGERIAYVIGGALHLRELVGGHRELAADPDPLITWGLPEFIAAEEMGRFRGHWWSPEGDTLAACRVDDRATHVLYLSDPASPDTAPTPIRYPVAGPRNAVVTLHLFDLESARVDIDWDREAFPYLASVRWSAGAPLTLLVQSRDQRTTRILEVDRASGATSTVLQDEDPDWVELVPGSPTRLDDGTVASTRDADDTRRLCVGDRLMTGPGPGSRDPARRGGRAVRRIGGSDRAPRLAVAPGRRARTSDAACGRAHRDGGRPGARRRLGIARRTAHVGRRAFRRRRARCGEPRGIT